MPTLLSQQAQEQRWIRSGVLEHAGPLIRELGGDLAQVCAATGISIAATQTEDIPLNFTQVVKFFDLAGKTCGTADFGLRLAERQSLAVLGPVWLLMQSAATVQQMLHDLQHYSSLHTRALGGDIVGSAEGIVLSYHLVEPLPIDDRQTIELGLALLCKELRRHAPKGWQPISVQLRYSPPESLERYVRAFGPRIAFNQDLNAVTIDYALLACPLNSARPSHHHLLADFLDRQKRVLPDDIVRSVTSVVRALIPLGNCTLAHTAQRLALSERTLQRRLQAADTRFVTLLDQVRSDLALKYLLQSSLKASEIAEILGYADLTALSRSFRRWHGVSMREAKANQQSKKPSTLEQPTMKIQ